MLVVQEMAYVETGSWILDSFCVLKCVVFSELRPSTL